MTHTQRLVHKWECTLAQTAVYGTRGACVGFPESDRVMYADFVCGTRKSVLFIPVRYCARLMALLLLCDTAKFQYHRRWRRREMLKRLFTDRQCVLQNVSS